MKKPNVRPTSNLDGVAEQIRENLSAMDAAREKVLPLCRESIRYSSDAIRAVHRREFKQAEGILQLARTQLDEIEKVLSEWNELCYAGYVRDAQKEYAEGCITLSIVTQKQVPSPGELGVSSAPYLNGMGEAIGEIRRFLLDSMRRGDMSRGEEFLEDMDDIYGVLVTMDYPDAITCGLKRTTDSVRGILEKTRGDLTMAVRQIDLGAKIESMPVETVPVEDVSQSDTPVAAMEETALTGKELGVFEVLSKWRHKRATEEQLPVFMIAHDAWLRQIIKMRPTNPDELTQIKGFGERRANKYGMEILQILRKQGL